MKTKQKIPLPPHLQRAEGLPRSHEERLRWIQKRAEEGYYDSEQVKKATAEALTETLLGFTPRRAGK